MSRKKQQTDLFKTKMICQKVVRSDKLLKFCFFFSTFLLTSHFLTFLFSSIPGISISSSSVLALNSNILGLSYLTKLIVCFAATFLAIKNCHQKVLFPVVVGVFWEWCTLRVIPGSVPGSNSSSLQICSGLALEVHTSQTEDSSPCWPHSISPTLFPFPDLSATFFGSAKNPVRFCTSAIQKIKHNTLCRFRFQFSSCQLSFFIFLDFFCSLFLFSFCLSDSVCLYWRCIFLHLISLSCILLIFWFTQQVWDSKDLQTASDLNKAGRKQKWWRQIWQMEEILVPGY